MKYYASGKLLLFGEYLVLRGARCLAIPLRYGQSMTVTTQSNKSISWRAKTGESVWFSASFDLELECMEASNTKKARQISELLTHIKAYNATLFHSGLAIETQTDFPAKWGFGTSSTLISLLAEWSDMNPYLLLENSFGGSGYDVACAKANHPILYRIESKNPIRLALAKAVTSKLLFVYSGKKQETKSELTRFDSLQIALDTIEKMNRIVEQAANATAIESFEDAMAESEEMLSQILKRRAIKDAYFPDYPFAVKSLGAWGGDFFMASFRNEAESRSYFKKRGYPIQFKYDELIKT